MPPQHELSDFFTRRRLMPSSVQGAARMR